MSYLEPIFRFLGWWFINIDMVLLVFLALGTFLLFFKQIPCGKFLIFIGLSGFIILSFVPVGLWTLEFLENRFPEQATLPREAKGIILLGGSFSLETSKARHQPSYNIAAGRLIRFVQLAKEYPHLQRAFTGTALEVELAKKEFARLGLDPATVLYENAAMNTHGNASNSAHMLKPSPEEIWVLVTSACHMARSVGLFRKAGFNIFPCPVDYHTPGRYELCFPIGLKLNLVAWQAAIREICGSFINYFTGRADSSLSAP